VITLLIYAGALLISFLALIVAVYVYVIMGNEDNEHENDRELRSTLS
jgi:hypothetical protein